MAACVREPDSLSQEEKEERTLHFLFEAANKLALVAPAASRSMVARMRALAASTDVGLHTSVVQRFCRRCSQIYVPGSNCFARVKQPLRRRRRRRPRPRAPKAKAAAVKGGSQQVQHAHSKLLSQQKNSTKNARRRKSMCYICCVCGCWQRFPLPRRPRPDAAGSFAARIAASKPAEAFFGRGGHRRAVAQEAKNAALAVKRARAAKKVASATASATAAPETEGKVGPNDAACSTSNPPSQKRRRQRDKMAVALEAVPRSGGGAGDFLGF